MNIPRDSSQGSGSWQHSESEWGWGSERWTTCWTDWPCRSIHCLSLSCSLLWKGSVRTLSKGLLALWLLAGFPNGRHWQETGSRSLEWGRQWSPRTELAVLLQEDFSRYLSNYLSTYQSIIGSNKRLSHLPLQLGPEVFPGFQTNAAHFFSMPCP